MSEAVINPKLKCLVDLLERKGLLKRLQLSDEDLADSIWLALKMGAVESSPVDELYNASNNSSLIDSREIVTQESSPPSEPVIKAYSEDSTTQESEPAPFMRGLPFQAPAAPALQNSLTISRALRPLMRRVPSATRAIFDEEATVTHIAEKDIWLPVTKPEPERWLNLELVIEESRSSFIWQETVDDLQQLLENQGAFRSIRVWSLIGQDKQPLALVRRRKGGDRAVSVVTARGNSSIPIGEA